MNILLATNAAYLPQRFGGSQSSTHELVLSLKKKGHNVSVMARLVPGGLVHFMNRLKSRLSRQDFPVDNLLGYPTFRGWGKEGTIDRGLGEVFLQFQPDVVIVQAEIPLSIAKSTAALGIPTVVYIRDVEDFNRLGGDPTNLSGIHYIANSHFTSERFYSTFGIVSTVIPPLVFPASYCVESRRKVVLYVNPHPKKGQNIAIALATARRDIDFVFIESWPLDADVRANLEQAISTLHNVTLRKPTTSMREVYSNARVLLVPSQLEETWGRVATEAQINGIPVLASNRGGLPESVGDGGIIVPFDAPIEQWNEALSDLWDEPARYEYYAKAALLRSQRREIQPDYLLDQVERVLFDVINERTAFSPRQ